MENSLWKNLWTSRKTDCGINKVPFLYTHVETSNHFHGADSFFRSSRPPANQESSTSFGSRRQHLFIIVFTAWYWSLSWAKLITSTTAQEYFFNTKFYSVLKPNNMSFQPSLTFRVSDQNVDSCLFRATYIPVRFILHFKNEKAHNLRSP